MKLKDKVTLITGASRGIGRETAILFAEEGANVIINFRSNVNAANDTLKLCTGNGHMLLKADISQPDEAQKMVHEIISNYGQIDILINNAGIFEPQKIDEVDYLTWQNSWNNILGINLTGLANLSFLVAKQMIQKKSGHIVNVSCRGAFRGEPDCPAYGASKGGVNSLSQSMAKALGKYNISVTAVAPGFVETEMAQESLESDIGDFLRNESPFGRVASPREVAHTILFLAQNESRFLSGGIVDINGASFLRM